MDGQPVTLGITPFVHNWEAHLSEAYDSTGRFMGTIIFTAGVHPENVFKGAK
jgi:hypothetical protein